MNRIGRAIEMVVLQSRWLVAPFLLGLIVGLGALLYKFVFKLFDFVTQVRPAPEEEVIVGVLKLVDLSLTANLLLIVICSRKLRGPDRPCGPHALAGGTHRDRNDGELRWRAMSDWTYH